jgi:hypothetical protein
MELLVRYVFMGYWKNMDMDSWITGSLDTVKYGLLLIALHRLDLASLETM